MGSIKTRKLEIGPKDKRITDTWETLDMLPGENVDIVADIRNPLPVKDDVYDLVYMSHVLEHVPWYQTTEVLKELYRILKNKGVLEVWVPDFKKVVGGYLDHSLIRFDGWYRFNPERDPMLWVNGRIFTYGPGEDNWHRAVFDKKHLRNCMLKAGFVAIKKLEQPRGIGHGWINLGMKGVKIK